MVKSTITILEKDVNDSKGSNHSDNNYPTFEYLQWSATLQNFKLSKSYLKAKLTYYETWITATQNNAEVSGAVFCVR